MTDPRLQGVYAITDASLMQHNFAQAVEDALKGGCSIIQYRDKSTDTDKRLLQTKIIRQLCNIYYALFIINDDIQLAIDSKADGVHLGKEDGDIAAAREQLGQNKIIGVSCYNQLALAIEAEQAGADYVAFGAFFNSTIKPDAINAPISLIAEAKQQIQLPICCIGGITISNASELITAGTDMIAVISELFASEDVKQSSQKLSGLF